jgi:hypothetical protein
VAEHDPGRAEAGARPQRRRDDGHAREVLGDQVEAGQRRDVGEAHGLQALDGAAAAGPVDQAHERLAQLVGGALGPHHLLPDGGVRGPAADGEVVGLDDGAAPVDATLADDHVGGHEALELAVLVVGADAGEPAGLVEGSVVEQPVDALADRELALRALARDALLTAHLVRQRLPAAEFLELGLPGHGTPA